MSENAVPSPVNIPSPDVIWPQFVVHQAAMPVVVNADYVSLIAPANDDQRRVCPSTNTEIVVQGRVLLVDEHLRDVCEKMQPPRRQRRDAPPGWVDESGQPVESIE